MSDDMFPRLIAYLVGGPADGQEHEVSAGIADLIVPALVKPSVFEWSADPTLPIRTVAHSYKPCPETGEWLWQGVR